ncbi:MAG: hypothetical protein KatS3mg085_451 [Candidatus Dojkabacteria bacterium]|nr:MAG: hypothetical protein KatS3mg085_451 [Candidatus Dojkabacteria bacterium]
MELLKVRSQIRSIVLAILGIIAFLLFLRISFELVEANRQNGVVRALFTVTDYLINPFEGSVILDDDSDLKPFNFDALFALVTYVVLGFVFIDFVTGFLHERLKDVVKNIVDALFKLVEFLLILRIIFIFFEIGIPRSAASGIVKFIYNITDWSDVVDIKFVIENLAWSSIITLGIVAVFDILSEQLIDALFDYGNKGDTVITKKVVKTKTIPQPTQQNITINVPVPPPQYTSGNPFGGNANKPK